MHAVWSTYIPITLVESFFPNWGTKPWLDTKRLGLTWIIFILGSAYLCYTIFLEENFFASAGQLIGAVAAIVILVRIAFILRYPTNTRAIGFLPAPWIAGSFALLISSLYMLTEMLPGWLRVVACLLLIMVFVAVIHRWSQRIGWTAMHRLSMAAGGVLTYAWLGVWMEPESVTKTMLDMLGSMIFAFAAISLIALAAVKLQKLQRNIQNETR